jgi:hypothetical protein
VLRCAVLQQRCCVLCGVAALFGQFQFRSLRYFIVWQVAAEWWFLSFLYGTWNLELNKS